MQRPFYFSMKRFISKSFTFFIFLTLPALPAYSFELLNSRLDLTYENISLPHKEIMGLAGGSYLFKTADIMHIGLGVYGAVRGRRGGFFTGGGQIQLDKTLSPYFSLGAEGFIGGGGGGSAPQGGGLMLRGALYTLLNVRDQHFKIGYSQIRFPSGNINSSQLFVGYRSEFKSLFLPGRSNKILPEFLDKLHNMHISSDPQNFSFQISNYFPSGEAMTVNDKPIARQLNLVGVRYQDNLISNFWFDFETGAALGGGIDGFAQVFSGVSYKIPISQRWAWSSGGLVGAAGGGNVSTGGGVIVKAYTGPEFMFTKDWSLFMHMGYLVAPDGKFAASTINLNIAKYYKGLMYSQGNKIDSKDFKNVYLRKFRIRPGLQNYSFYSENARKSSNVPNRSITSIQLKLDSFINNHFYFSGQAIGATTGGAGGYAVGLIGLGYQIIPELNVEALFGAAGGGGIDVGAGAIVEPGINYEIPVSESWSIELGLGYVKALKGKLASWVSSVGGSYYFSMPGLG